MSDPVLVSPPHEHNDKCCGGTRYNVTTNDTVTLGTNGVNGTILEYTVVDWSVFFHNNAHYDDAHQVCCNDQEGYPSTRDDS